LSNSDNIIDVKKTLGDKKNIKT